MTDAGAIGLLLNCARKRVDGAALQSLVSGPIDWPQFFSAARIHDLEPLCFWQLNRECREAVPSGGLAGMRSRFESNTAGNLRLTAELFSVLDAFGNAAIPTAVIKGPAYAWSLYETPGLRPYLDLDLLIAARDRRRGVELLLDLGYRSLNRLPIEEDLRFQSREGQITMIRDTPESVIDLHWALAPPAMGLDLSADRMWSALAPDAIAGRSVLTFAPDYRLALAALHGGKHGWTTLLWLADIDRMLESGAIDWGRVLNIARDLRLRRALFLALRLSRDLIGSRVPGSVLKLIEGDCRAMALARDAADCLKGAAPNRFLPRKIVYQLGVTEGRMRQARMLWKNATEPCLTDADSMPGRLPAFGLYRLFRPMRLAVKYLRLLASRSESAKREGEHHGQQQI